MVVSTVRYKSRRGGDLGFKRKAKPQSNGWKGEGVFLLFFLPSPPPPKKKEIRKGKMNIIKMYLVY